MGTDHENEDCVPKWEYERLRAEKDAAVQEIEAWLVGERCEHPTASPLRDEVERLRAEAGRLRTDVKGSREWAEAEAAEVERLRAEAERLRDKLSFAELYLANYKALYRSACVRARLYGDPTPLPERD